MADPKATDGTKHVGNGFDTDVMRGYVGRIENLLDDMERERSSFMTKCKSIRGDIALIVAEAKDVHGVPKKSLKAVVRVRELEDRADRIRDELEPEIQETFDQIRHALGDLADMPLGRATLDKHPDSQRTA